MTFGRIAERYEEARGGVRRGRELADAITPWLSPHSRVLDVGAGTGVVSAALAAAGHTVTPVELAPEMARKAERRFPAACVLADATRLPIARASVDAVTFVWVLHHVGDPVAALWEAGRVVRPGGSVIHVSGLAATSPGRSTSLSRPCTMSIGSSERSAARPDTWMTDPPGRTTRPASRNAATGSPT